MIKKNIQVVLFPQKKKDGTKPIKIRTTIKRKVQYLNLGISVLETQWDSRKNLVKSNHPEYKLYNNQIEEGIKSIYNITPSDIAKSSNSKEALLFKSVQDILLTRLKYERSKNRIGIEKKLNTAIKHLTKCGLSKTLFLNFNLEKIKQFHSYLFSVGGIKENSMGSYHRVIRSTLKQYALENEIPLKQWSDPYANFKTSRKSQPKLALRAKQVIRLEDYILFKDSKTGHEFNAACMFVFSIYSYGCRFGDVFSLKWGNINENIIRFETEKNQHKINIKLNPKLNNILKYFTPLNDFYSNPDNFDSEVISEIRNWYPNINGLIEAEIEYLKFRQDYMPKGHELLDELFPHLNERVVFQEEINGLKEELGLIISVRDNYISSFITEYSKFNKGYLFPYFKEGETDYRKIKNRKESSNAIVNKSLKFVAAECELPQISFHEARHTFAYQARVNGFDLYEISKALGHSSISVTDSYLKDFDNEGLMDKNESLIEGLNKHYLI